MSLFVIDSILIGVPVLYVACQLLSLLRLTGVLRLAAASPLLAWIAWFVIFRRDIARDPTSHNLLPFEVLQIAFWSLLFLGVLFAFQAIAKRARSSEPSR